MTERFLLVRSGQRGLVFSVHEDEPAPIPREERAGVVYQCRLPPELAGKSLAAIEDWYRQTLELVGELPAPGIAAPRGPGPENERPRLGHRPRFGCSAGAARDAGNDPIASSLEDGHARSRARRADGSRAPHCRPLAG